MGQKGDKHTNEAALTSELMVTKLEAIGSITSKKMFGGHGIFHDGKMFAIIDSKGVAFLRTGEGNQADFTKAGAERHAKMPYHAIPAHIFSDGDQLSSWAMKAIKESKS